MLWVQKPDFGWQSGRRQAERLQSGGNMKGSPEQERRPRGTTWVGPEAESDLKKIKMDIRETVALKWLEFHKYGKGWKIQREKKNTRSNMELKELWNPGNTFAKTIVKEYDTVAPLEM